MNPDQPPEKPPEQVEDIEVQLLLEGVYLRRGVDFREYARASVKRRILKRVHDEELGTISALQEKALRDPPCMGRLLHALAITHTRMFRDPGMFAAFREKIVPMLRTYPFIRIWHAGCSTGEEVYSMAILLREEAIYDRCRIYATDMNETVLAQAKSGIFPLTAMKENTSNYIKAGGMACFSDYYTANYDHAIFRPELREHVVFCQHNLTTDSVFNEFNVILCRNVMIYFNRTLQARVQDLFHQSLATFGFFAPGNKETPCFTQHESSYECLDEREKIYRRVR